MSDVRITTPTFPHLDNAPIVEAIIDFRVRLPPEFDITRFKALHPQFQSEYPKVEDRKLIEHEFALAHAPGKAPVHNVKDHGLHGYFFHSADNTRIVQFRRNGFTFNRLQPYTSWEEVFPEATRFWKLFVQTCPPVEISRIAVRYINRLMLPANQLQLPVYLAAPPALPGGPESSLAAISGRETDNSTRFVSGFVSKVMMNDLESGTVVAVVQALEPPSDDRYIPVLLDIDVSQENVSNLGPDAVLTRFDKLREMKNCTFFGSITPKALELFK